MNKCKVGKPALLNSTLWVWAKLAEETPELVLEE